MRRKRRVVGWFMVPGSRRRIVIYRTAPGGLTFSVPIVGITPLIMARYVTPEHGCVQ